MRFRDLLAPAALALALTPAIPAYADVTGTRITTPDDALFVLYRNDTEGPVAPRISGTATGSGSVDIVCVGGGEVTRLGGVAGNVPVAADGRFAIPAAPLHAISDPGNAWKPSRTCRLHAVPAGTTPADLGPFTGPRLGVSKLSIDFVTGAGANDGIVDDYYLYAAGLAFSAEYFSFGGCGIFRSWIMDPDTLGPHGSGFGCSGTPPESPERGFFGLQVDGGPAYSPGQLAGGTGGLGLQATPGFPTLGIGPVIVDPETGDLSLTETNPLVKCAPENPYPPTFAGCQSFAPVHVQVRRTTEHTRDGQVIRLVDRWSSTDGRPHRLDLALQQSYCLGTDSASCATDFVYRFPGDAAYAAHNANHAPSIPGPLPAGAPIFAKDATEIAAGGTAIVPDQPADGATFSARDTFDLRYTDRTIPADGVLTLTHRYVRGRTPEATERLVAELSAGPTTEDPAAAPPAPPAGGPTGANVAPARPTLSRRGAPRVQRRGAGFRVITGDRVACPGGGAACTVDISATTRRRSVGSARIEVASGRSAQVALRLGRTGARALRRLGRLRLTVTLSARVASTAPVSGRRTFTIRLPR